MTRKLSWRLSKLPSVEELLSLVEKKLITQYEAKEILFNTTDEDEPKVTELQAEIKFLRDLVETLSKGKREIIVKQIEIIKEPYKVEPWYQPYKVWMTTNTDDQLNYVDGATSINTANAMSMTTTNDTNLADFSDIKTF